jgi:hypothetical protein
MLWYPLGQEAGWAPGRLDVTNDSQNFSVSRLCASSGILNISKHNVSETGSVSVLRGGRRRHTLLGHLERANLNHWCSRG